MNTKINLTNEDGTVAPWCGGRILLRRGRYEDLFVSDKKRIRLESKKNHHVEYMSDYFVIYHYKDDPIPFF